MSMLQPHPIQFSIKDTYQSVLAIEHICENIFQSWLAPTSFPDDTASSTTVIPKPLSPPLMILVLLRGYWEATDAMGLCGVN
mmetsp:Transcript_12030/g.13691  ORF Transcript_12030/g.13691 Transcript_12030/m.13691 type:complete len:82 (+) Transcript_12030:1275-1520(+)